MYHLPSTRLVIACFNVNGSPLGQNGEPVKSLSIALLFASIACGRPEPVPGSPEAKVQSILVDYAVPFERGSIRCATSEVEPIKRRLMMENELRSPDAPKGTIAKVHLCQFKSTMTGKMEQVRVGLNEADVLVAYRGS